MRIPTLFLSLAISFFSASGLHAQDSILQQNPGAQQDAEAAREKLLKAEDELDNIQANSEATKTSVDSVRTDVATLQTNLTQLQTDNAALKQQLADLQAAFAQYKADQIQARQTLIDNVAAMIAAAKAGKTKSTKKKDTTSSEATTETAAPKENSAAAPIPSNLAPPPDNPPAQNADTDGDAPPAPIKPQKGYYHVVASGETLTMICEAYRDSGVNVTVSAIRKANGLTATSELKAGQKLFIPKPGT